MKARLTLLLVLFIYLSTQLLGMQVGSTLLTRIEQKEFMPAVEDPESTGSSAMIFVYILMMTGVVLFLIKYRLGIVIRLLLFTAIFIGIILTLWSLSHDWLISLILTVLIFIIFLWKNANIHITNITLILTLAGFGGWLGASLAFTPALILLLALAAYDLVAVFGTKHMVTLAEESKGKYQFMVTVPMAEGDLGLGTGDLAIPLVFTVSVLRDYTVPLALTTSMGGLLGLAVLVYAITQREKVTLPALPPIALGLLTGFAVGSLLL
ncbi:presenilin family intramembrane aspartyl protease [Candidatus Altiarchaeota archaeon]